MKIQLLNTETVIPSLGLGATGLASYISMENLGLTLASRSLPLVLPLVLGSADFCLAPGFDTCPKEGSCLGRAKPVLQNSGGDPGIQKMTTLP